LKSNTQTNFESGEVVATFLIALNFKNINIRKHFHSFLIWWWWWCYPTPSEGWGRGRTPRRPNSRAWWWGPRPSFREVGRNGETTTL